MKYATNPNNALVIYQLAPKRQLRCSYVSWPCIDWISCPSLFVHLHQNKGQIIDLESFDKITIRDSRWCESTLTIAHWSIQQLEHNHSKSSFTNSIPPHMESWVAVNMQRPRNVPLPLQCPLVCSLKLCNTNACPLPLRKSELICKLFSVVQPKTYVSKLRCQKNPGTKHFGHLLLFQSTHWGSRKNPFKIHL